MKELLTSLDVVNQSFKKSIRGYDAAEVDEFLDNVSESLQVYAQKTKDMERISRRAEDAEMAVSSTMAHLIVETDVVSRSPLLSRAMGFYRYVMYTQ